MAKYHINPRTGNPGACRAQVSCPYGDLENDHFPTKEAARVAYENGSLDKTFSTLKKLTDEVIDESLISEESPEGWGHSTDELLMEMSDHYETERQEQISKLTSARDYFNADDEGLFADKNYEATPEDISYGKNHSVVEAVSYGDSLRGFTTLQLFDQLSSNQNPANSIGQKNLKIREELNERYTGFPRIKPVLLQTPLDFSDAYDVGRFYETGISQLEDHDIAKHYRGLSDRPAASASQDKASLAGFTSKELVASLRPLDPQNSNREELKAQARITNELKSRLKGEEFIPENIETPF